MRQKRQSISRKLDSRGACRGKRTSRQTEAQDQRWCAYRSFGSLGFEIKAGWTLSSRLGRRDVRSRCDADPPRARRLPRTQPAARTTLISAVEAPAAIAPSYRTSTDHRDRIWRIGSRAARSGLPGAPASSAICRQDMSVARRWSYCPSAVQRSSQASAAGGAGAEAS
jgi:hypothetical protein